MLDSLMKYREHLASLVLFVVATNIVVAVVRVFLRMGDVGLTGAMLGVGDFMGLVSVLALGCAVGSCVMTKTPTKHARVIALLAALLVTIGTVMAIVFFVIAMFSRQAVLASMLEAVGGLMDILLKGGAAFALWTLVRRAPRPVSTGTLDQPATAELPPANAPTTPRDAAAGARWNSAAEAAKGASAQWGNAQRGWQAAEPAALPAGPAAAAEPPAPAQAPVVTPTTEDALNGPPAKASKDLWRS